MVDKKKSLGDKVKENVMDNHPTVSVEITFPKPVYKDLKRYAYENTADCFWLAFHELYLAKQNQLDLTRELKFLADRDDVLAQQVREVKEYLNMLDDQEGSERTHFGRKEEDTKK